MATNKDIPGVTPSWAERSELSELLKKSNVNTKSARFFIVQRKEGSFATCSPFFLHKTILANIGDIKNIKKLRSGDLLIEVKDEKQAKNIMKCAALGNIPITVSAHNSLNCSRGVVSDRELMFCSDEEILTELEDQHVCAVKRITIRRDGKVVPTAHIILTFNTPSLPSYINAGFSRCSVRPYIPNPLRCFQCQRFGHSKASCRGAVTCARCAEVGHDSDSCSGSPKCVNCSGNHPAYSRTCPKWNLEKEIQTIKIKNNLSFPEARKLVESRTPKPGLTYSAAVKQTKTIATQTETIQSLNEKIKEIMLLTTSTSSNNSSSVNNTTRTKSDNNNSGPQQENIKQPPNTLKETSNPETKKTTGKKSKKTKKPKIPPKFVYKSVNRYDFLKKRPNLEDDPLKMYVSSEDEGMLTGEPAAKADVPKSAAQAVVSESAPS